MEKLTIEERLNDTISEKDEEIEKLQSKINYLEFQIDFNTRAWELNQYLDIPDFMEHLHFPRLEMHFEKIGDYRYRWIYGLAFQPYWIKIDRKNINKYYFTPFHETTTSSNVFGNDFTRLSVKDILFQILPMYDGMNIRYDSLKLKLPVYFIYKEKKFIEQIIIYEEQQKKFDYVDKNNQC